VQTADETPELEVVPKTSSPIAVFEQGERALRFEGFEFSGYYAVERIALLAPYSKALAKLLEQKWKISDSRGNMQTKQRRPEDWTQSLSE